MVLVYHRLSNTRNASFFHSLPNYRLDRSVSLSLVASLTLSLSFSPLTDARLGFALL